MASTSVRSQFPQPGTAPPPPKPASRIRRLGLPMSFLAPALVLLGVWILYPAIATVIRSLFDDQGNHFVWFDNYDRMFSDDIIYKAIRNNVIWILIAPITVTALGLSLAVLVERISGSSVFKIILVLALDISLFAVGGLWRIMYQQDPSQGAINAGIKVVHDTFKSSGVLPRAQPSSDALTPQFKLKQPLTAGGAPGLIGLTGISPDDVPGGAEQAVKPAPKQGAVVGVVWRDFSPGGGK